MAIVKLTDPSAKTPIDLGTSLIKRRGNTFYLSQKPNVSRRKGGDSQKVFKPVNK